MSSKLSSQQLEEFSQAFKMLDVDGDGRVTGSVWYVLWIVVAGDHEAVSV